MVRCLPCQTPQQSTARGLPLAVAWSRSDVSRCFSSRRVSWNGQHKAQGPDYRIGAVGLTLEPATTLCKSYGDALDIPNGLPSSGPSQSLRDLASLQLQLLFQLLDKSGCSSKELGATVYARSLSDAPAGGLQLLRVASWPPSSSGVLSLLSGLSSEEDRIVLRTEAGFSADGRSLSAEESLVREEVVALPNSRTLVLPLAEGSFLVGMLVIDHVGDPASRSSSSGGSGTSIGSSSSSMPPWSSAVDPEPAGTAPADRTSGSSSSSSSSRQLVSRLNPSLPLTDEHLGCIRMVAPALAKAVALEHQAALAQLQQAARQQLAQGLLQKAKGPLTALQTFTHMLVPRLPDGAPDKDMAQGILLQGSRLSDVVQQLEVALHPHTGLRPAAGGVLSGGPWGAAAGGGGSVGGRVESAAALEDVGKRKCLPPGCEEGQEEECDVSYEECEVTYTEGQGVDSGSSSSSGAGAAAAQAEQAQQDVASSAHSAAVEAVWLAHSSGSESDDHSSHTIDIEPGAEQQQQQQQQWQQQAQQQQQEAPGLGVLGERRASTPAAPKAFAPAAGAAGATAGPCDLVDTLISVLTAASKLARVTGILFIVNQPLQLAAGTGTSSSRSTSNRPLKELPADFPLGRPKLRRPVRPAGLPSGQASGRMPPAATTVDVVVQGSSSDGGGKLLRPVWLGQGKAATATAQQQQQGADGVHVVVGPAAPAQATVVEATAIQPPSQQEEHRHHHHHQQQQQQQQQRQLRVAVRPSLVQRIVGYVVDIALQCTPAGGQVCVTARNDGGGVEVLVLHTGRMVPERLHSASRILADALQRPAPQPTSRQADTPAGSSAMAGEAAGQVAVAQQQAATAATGGAAAGSSGSSCRSVLMSLQLAEQLVQEVGGHMHITYPFNMVNAETGMLDVGTAVEIWLPRAR